MNAEQNRNEKYQMHLCRINLIFLLITAGGEPEWKRYAKEIL